MRWISDPSCGASIWEEAIARRARRSADPATVRRALSTIVPARARHADKPLVRQLAALVQFRVVCLWPESVSWSSRQLVVVFSQWACREMRGGRQAVQFAVAGGRRKCCTSMGCGVSARTRKRETWHERCMRASGWGTGWVWWVVVLGAGRLVAEEPAAAFLNALREKQYNDEALRLSGPHGGQSADTGGVPPGDSLQRGVTMIQAAVLERDRAVRESRLNVAKENLERFLREQPDHPKKSSARRQFGIPAARVGAHEDGASGADRMMPTMRKEAAGLYDQAYQVFDSAVDRTEGAAGQAEGASPSWRLHEGDERAAGVAAERIPGFAAAAGRDAGGQGGHRTGRVRRNGRSCWKMPRSSTTRCTPSTASRLWGIQARLNEARVPGEAGRSREGAEVF